MKTVTLYFNSDHTEVRVVIARHNRYERIADRLVTHTRRYTLHKGDPSADRLGRVLAGAKAQHYGAQQGWGAYPAGQFTASKNRAGKPA